MSRHSWCPCVIWEICWPGIVFVLEKPNDPVLSNCPTFVIEGDDVICNCQASGSLPAVVTWVVGGTTDSKVLVLRNVSRSLDGQNYTCNQYWLGVNRNWRTTTYSVQVHCESPDVCNPQDRHAGSVIMAVTYIYIYIYIHTHTHTHPA